jgi:hypothetical protein
MKLINRGTSYKNTVLVAFRAVRSDEAPALVGIPPLHNSLLPSRCRCKRARAENAGIVGDAATVDIARERGEHLGRGGDASLL